MDIEKEVRYKINDDECKKILSVSKEFKAPAKMLDITLGAYGFDSLAKTGRIYRVRQKGDKITLEIKKRTEDGGWLEQAIKLDSVREGLNFLILVGLEPYLCIDRVREVRGFKGLKIFIDDIDLLGKYVEVELQESENAEEELNEFLKLTGINAEPQLLYGDIFKERLLNQDFKKAFESKLLSVLEEENSKE